jgi:NAD(P)-dependent dehydrogenase (short-subunit alcohol dehydrogenase family)
MAGLDGKVAFVTGGGSGIGRGICERLAADGADVCVTDIDLAGAEETAEAVRATGRKAHVVQHNTASEPRTAEAVASCVDALGRLDVAVANAGIGRGGSVLEMSLKDWQDQVDVNLTGVFLTVQATARKMVELGNGGRIVCMASLAAVSTGAMTWAYSATKAGVAMMVRGWAQELGPLGITVNAIGPGIIETPLAGMLAGEAGGAIRRGVERRTPLGRVGQPGDIAGLVSFLAGPDAAFMTGAYLLMDGGLRDSINREAPEPGSELADELARSFAAAEQRRARLQPLIDER